MLMQPAKRLLRCAPILAASLLCACGSGSSPTISIDVIGTEIGPFERGVRLSSAGQLVRAATAEGLVALDEHGRVGPALADRWIVTDDGRSYIFRLREGLWANGESITAETARRALREALAALDGTGLAQELAGIEDVRAMTGRVVEIRLGRPVPDLLQLLAQPELGLFRDGRGAGPMRLGRAGPLAVLSPIPPMRLGRPQPENWRESARDVRLHALPAHTATRRFAEGEVDIVLGGRFQSYPLAASVAGLSRRMLRIDPAPGLLGLAVLTTAGPLGSAATREALAMAIDRAALASVLGVPGWTPTSRLAAPGHPDDSGAISERWSDLSIDQRRAQAAARIARMARGGAARPLRLGLPAGPGADALFARISEDFAAIGVPLQRVGEGDPADLRLLDVVARYGRVEWYLGQLSCAAARGQCSAEADARLAEARLEADPARRAALLAQAEAQLTETNVFIPLGPPVRWSLVRERTPGFVENPAAFHPLPPLAQRPR